MADVINPGSLVVPLAAIIDQLRSRLSQSEIDALLSALVIQRRNTVAPGGLITAALFNQMQADLDDLFFRVSALEASGGSTTPGEVVIFLPPIGASMRVNDQIEISGLNFRFSSAQHRVLFDGIPVNGFLAGSNDNLLRVIVPTLPNLGTTGRAAVLSVGNGSSTATRGIFVQPPDQPLTGTIDFTVRTSEPSPPAANGNTDFPFLLTPRGLNRGADFLATATLTGQSWSTQILDSSRQVASGNRIPINPDQPTLVYVRVAIPNGANGQSFSLTLSVASGGVGGSSPVSSVTVGQAPTPQDETYTLQVGSVSSSVFSNGTLRLPAGGATSIPINLTSTLAGQFVYNLVLELVSEVPGGSLATGWSFGFLQPATTPPSATTATTPSTGPNGSMLFAVAVAPTGASTTGRLRLRVRRTGATLDRLLDINLARTT